MFLEILTKTHKKNENSIYTKLLIDCIKCNKQSWTSPHNPHPELTMALKKQRCLKDYIDNEFMTSDIKKQILDDFRNAQRTYMAFTKLSKI